MEIRRLNVNEDLPLYKEVYQWDKDYPRWYKQADVVFRPSFVDFIAQAKADDQADIGIFNGELIGLISLTLRAKGVYEAHLWAKRGTSVDILAHAGRQVLSSLQQLGLREVYVWIERKNRAVQTLCKLIGMEFKGITLWKGNEGRLTQWRRFSV